MRRGVNRLNRGKEGNVSRTRLGDTGGMVVAMAVVLLLGTARYASAQTKEFVIGDVIPETGRSAKYGESHKRGAEMALEEINAAGGVNGIKLKVVYGDGKCAPVEAANATERLIVRDKVDV